MELLWLAKRQPRVEMLSGYSSDKLASRATDETPPADARSRDAQRENRKYHRIRLRYGLNVRSRCRRRCLHIASGVVGDAAGFEIAEHRVAERIHIRSQRRATGNR